MHYTVSQPSAQWHGHGAHGHPRDTHSSAARTQGHCTAQHGLSPPCFTHTFPRGSIRGTDATRLRHTRHTRTRAPYDVASYYTGEHRSGRARKHVTTQYSTTDACPIPPHIGTLTCITTHTPRHIAYSRIPWLQHICDHRYRLHTHITYSMHT